VGGGVKLLVPFAPLAFAAGRGASTSEPSKGERPALEGVEVDENARALDAEIWHEDGADPLAGRPFHERRLKPRLVASKEDVRALAHHERIFLLLGVRIAAQSVRRRRRQVAELEEPGEGGQAVVPGQVPGRGEQSTGMDPGMSGWTKRGAGIGVGREYPRDVGYRPLGVWRRSPLHVVDGLSRGAQQANTVHVAAIGVGAQV
jgi:hypothetical protein